MQKLAAATWRQKLAADSEIFYGFMKVLVVKFQNVSFPDAETGSCHQAVETGS
jgi:hypothetical protein